MIPVLTTDARYGAAIAELPLSLRPADQPTGAIVVVAGTDWARGVRSAIDAGALAVVVPDPALTGAADLGALADDVRVPVIVERPLLRADLADDARTPTADARPAVIVVDGAAPAARLPALARDAAGWGRILAGGPLSVDVARGGIGSLRGASGVTVVVNLAATARPGGGWLRAAALGDPLVEVEVEGLSARVTVASAGGSLALPTRFESSSRLALRRAAAALASGEPTRDLHDLASDTAIADRLVDVGA
jgi:hypothetical protein